MNFIAIYLLNPRLFEHYLQMNANVLDNECSLVIQVDNDASD